MIGKITSAHAALAGMERAGNKIEKVANNLNQAFAAAQNAQAADSVSVSEKAAVAPAVEDAMRGAVLPQNGDVSTQLVDALQAKTAYAASAAALRVSTAMEDGLLNMVKKT